MIDSMKIMKGSVLRVATLVLNLLAMFVLLPIIIHTLGDKMYGLWVLAASLTGYYYILDFGISSSVIRFVSQAIGKEDKNRINPIISNSIAMFSIMACIAVIITIVMIYCIKFFVSTELLNLSRTLIAIVGLEFVFTLPLRTYEGVMKAFLEFDSFSKLEIAKVVIRTVLLFVILKSGFGILALAVVNSGLNIALYLSAYVYTKIKYPFISFKRKFLNWKEMKKLFDFSKFIFLTTLGDILRFRIDTFIIAGFISLSSVAVYSISIKMIDYFMAIMIAVTTVVFPVFSKNEGARNFSVLRKNFIKSTRFTSLASFFIGWNLIIIGKQFIELWVGNEYTDSYIIMVILTIPYIIDLAQRMGYGVLQSRNKHYIYALLNGVEGIINLGLTLVLVKKIGMIGVALGTSVPLFILKGIIQPFYVCKHINLNFKKYLKSISKVWLPISMYFIVAYIISIHLLTNSYISIVMFLSIETLLFILLVYKLILTEEEKRWLSKVLKTLKIRGEI